MSSIQQWQVSINYLYPINDQTPKHPGRMVVVLYADAQAAIAAAFQSGMDQMIGGIEQVSYEQGQRDMLAKCIAVVGELPWSSGNWIAVDERAAILADVRALRDQS